MLVGCVVHDHVEDQVQTARMRFFHQLIEVGQGAIAWVNITIITHVITKILVGAGIDGRKPEGVYTQIGQVIQSGDNPRQITQSICVAVREAAGIDLVNNAITPP